MTQTLHGSLWGGRRWSGEDKESVGTMKENEQGHVLLLSLCVFRLRAGMVAENGRQRTGSRVSHVHQILADTFVERINQE